MFANILIYKKKCEFHFPKYEFHIYNSVYSPPSNLIFDPRDPIPVSMESD